MLPRIARMDLDAMIADITAEKSKLEKLTKKITNNKLGTSKKSLKNHILEAQSPSPQPATAPATAPTTISNAILATVASATSATSTISDKLQLNPNDFQKVPKATIMRILELLKNYVNMDKSFRLKHESLKTLYTAYLDLYKKYKATGAVNSTGAENENTTNSSSETGEVNKMIVC